VILLILLSKNELQLFATLATLYPVLFLPCYFNLH
jgi:hypothetical protein